MGTIYIPYWMYLLTIKRKEKRMEMEILKRIKIGDWVESLIYTVSFGFGEHISLWIARKFFRSNSCGCCERKEWLNRLTNKEYDGKCNQIKL
jgi:hypothetical protein